MTCLPRYLDHSLVFVFALGGILVGSAHAAEYFVSRNGSDENPGTRQRPFKTIARAADAVNPGDTCFLREGIYREVLRPKRSGRSGAEITFSNYHGEKVVFSGADVIDNWTAGEDDIYRAPMPWSLGDGNQVFADGRPLNEACWPSAGEEPLFKPRRATASAGSETTLECESIPGKKNAWRGAQLWCAGGSAWICWTSKVTAYDADTHTLTFDKARDRWYTPRAGNLFVLRGIRHALDAPGEWFYDASAKRLLVIPPDGADLKTIEAKRRMHAIDLSDRSYIRIKGIEVFAGGIRTDKRSSHLVLERLKGRFVSHSYIRDVSSKAGVLIRGSNNLVLSCDLGYSSASVLSVEGQDHRIINCRIHHGGYAGLWRGTVKLAGRRILFSHNTVRHAGRDLINTHGLMESLIQYNDVSEAGWLTKDLGMFYGHNTDFANTVFRRNLVHDNHAKHCAMGIYFDHLSHNAIVHGNVVWNVGMDPIRFNNPSYCNLVFNNTCHRTGSVGTFDHSRRNDLFACRYSRNIFNRPIRLPDNATTAGNLIIKDTAFKDPDAGDYRLKNKKDEDAGAYANNGELFRAGCDPDNPPSPLPIYKRPRIPWMNTVRNACFEFGTLEGWKKTHNSRAKLVKGNGWGNNWAEGKACETGTSKYECRLGPGRDGVRQSIKGLTPDVTYTLSAWVRVSDESETIVLGVKTPGRPEVRASASSTEWVRKSIDFTTGPKATEATIYLLKTSEGNGHAWCDNLTLPLRAKP